MEGRLLILNLSETSTFYDASPDIFRVLILAASYTESKTIHIKSSALIHTFVEFIRARGIILIASCCLLRTLIFKARNPIKAVREEDEKTDSEELLLFHVL
jgi:hypothetical protein